MPNVSSFGAQTDNAVVAGTVTDRQMIIPEVPPQGLMSVGPRVTPNFIKEPWNAQTSYVFYDVVKDGKGAAYIATKPVVPAGAGLTDEAFWFKWSDPDVKFEELQEVVKLFDGRIAQNASAITEEVARATAAEATKAPTNHASEETIYGVGNELNYGHVRLAADDTPMTSDANAGIAATPKTVTTAINPLNENVKSVQNDVTGLQGDVTGLQGTVTGLQGTVTGLQGTVTGLQNEIKTLGAVKSLFVIGDSYLAGHNPEGNVTGYGQIIKRALKLSTYKENALGGRKWDDNTASLITSDVNNYDTILIALGHNNMTANDLNVSQYVANVLNKIESLKYKGKVFLCSVLATAKYTCLRANTIDQNIVLGMQAAAYSFPCAFIPNGWSWLIDSADYGTADKGQHPKQIGQNIIAASIIAGFSGSAPLNAAKFYGGSNGVYIYRTMQSIIYVFSGVKGNSEQTVYNPKLPFRVIDMFSFAMQGSDGAVKNLKVSDDGVKVIYSNITNAVYGSLITTIPQDTPA